MHRGRFFVDTVYFVVLTLSGVFNFYMNFFTSTFLLWHFLFFFLLTLVSRTNEADWSCRYEAEAGSGWLSSSSFDEDVNSMTSNIAPRVSVVEAMQQSAKHCHCITL